MIDPSPFIDDEARLRAVALAAVEHARRIGARYAECRYMNLERERLVARDERVEAVSSSFSEGFGVRVLAEAHGRASWGFSCTSGLDEASLCAAIDRATAIARSSARLSGDSSFFEPKPPQRGRYSTPLEKDPFRVSLEEKVAFLLAPLGILRAHPLIRTAQASMDWVRIRKLLLTTEGSDVTQQIIFGGASMSCTAVGDDGKPQTRSFPGMAGSEMAQAGYEHVEALELKAHAEQTREEALALLKAAPCPDGVRTLLLGTNQLALQIHESCGHPSELDRVLGSEITLAGGSFLQPASLGALRYGSPRVNLTCDSITPGGLGTFGWDDEATMARKSYLVREGLFVDYLSSRETAGELGRASTGALRAESWNRIPNVRMTNISLEPGSGSLEDLIADTEDGVLMDTNRSWSIDDLRLNFQFSCEVKHGKRTRLLKNPLYTARTPQFWGSCDAVAGVEEWRLWGLATCGKSDPIQLMHVGHGTAPARFRDIEIRGAGE